MIQSASSYGKFIPQVFSKEIVETGAVFTACARANSRGDSLNGEFKISAFSREPIDFVFNLSSIFGETNPIPGCKMSWPKLLQDLKFIDNRWHTCWYSLQDEVNAGNMSFTKEGVTEEPYNDFLKRMRAPFANKELAMMFRLVLFYEY